MSTEFRPYLRRTLGQAPNPNVRHVIGDGKITSYKSVVGRFERVSGTHPITQDTVVDASAANTFGYGDITVSTGGSSTLYERIAEARRFVAAIDAQKQALFLAENPWHKDLTDANLQDVALIIPSPHTMLSYTFQGVNDGLVRWY